MPVAFLVVVPLWFAFGCEGVGGKGDGAADAEREAEDGEGGEELHFGGVVVGLFVCSAVGWGAVLRCVASVRNGRVKIIGESICIASHEGNLFDLGV